MDPMMLTKSSTVIIGQIAVLLGYLMNAIFWLLDKIGIPNIGLSIILFTIVILTALMPLTIRQQKFSKLQIKMQPEIKKIQEKYKNKKDQNSMLKQNEEIQSVYKKYGVSATGSCAQLLIQMPILFALYQIIYRIPAYVTQVKEAFFPLVTNLTATAGASEYLQSTQAAAMFAKQFSAEGFGGEVMSNTFIDVLNRFSTTDWAELAAKFPALSGDIAKTTELLNHYNNFLGLNMGNSPFYSMRTYWEAGAFGLAVASVVIPVLSALTQWISIKLTPQGQSTGDAQQDSMMQSMKMMNVMMPLMSAYFCFTLPAGMGLYWVASAVVRSIQQVVINKHIDRMDIDEMITKNVEKQAKRAAKNAGRETVSQRLMNQYSTMNTRNIGEESAPAGNALSEEQKEAALRTAQQTYAGRKYRRDSLAAKANLVREFNNQSDSGQEM